MECDCTKFENEIQYVLDYINENIEHFRGAINYSKLSGIIGSRISTAEGAVYKNGIMKQNYTDSDLYANDIINFNYGTK